MEYRNDLASVLLSGLPENERNHVVDAINRDDAEKLRRKRAAVDPRDEHGDDNADDFAADSLEDDFAET